MPDHEGALDLELFQHPVQEHGLGLGRPDAVTGTGRVAEARPVDRDDPVARRQPVDQTADREVLGQGAVAMDEHHRPSAPAQDDVHRQAVDGHELTGRLADNLGSLRRACRRDHLLGVPDRPFHGLGGRLARVADRLLGRPGHGLAGGIDGSGDLPCRAGEASANQAPDLTGWVEGKHGASRGNGPARRPASPATRRSGVPSGDITEFQLHCTTEPGMERAAGGSVPLPRPCPASRERPGSRPLNAPAARLPPCRAGRSARPGWRWLR